MSGPKTSRYFLTEKQWNFLRESREMKRVRRAICERIEQTRDSINDLISETDKYIEYVKSNEFKDKYDIFSAEELEKLKKTRDIVAEVASNADNEKSQDDITALEREEKVLKKAYEQLLCEKNSLAKIIGQEDVVSVAESDELYLKYGDTYEQLLQEYKILAEETGCAEEDIPFCEAAVSKLQSEIERLEEIASRAEEREYISKCVDEVMQEMGYELAGDRDVTKRNGNHFKSELYLFDEGTAVNVIKSDSGQITMELGGLDDTDRIPSVFESVQLCEDMTRFCEDYAVIEKKLAEKGIMAKRISVLPADEQYAQIINVKDYNMTDDFSRYEAEKKRKRRGSGVTIHNEVQ